MRLPRRLSSTDHRSAPAHVIRSALKKNLTPSCCSVRYGQRSMSGPDPTISLAVPLRLLVVLEQTLGHVTHAQNLRRLIPALDAVEPSFVDVPFDLSGWTSKLPGYGNWTIRAAVRARRAVRRHDAVVDAMIVHTQVPAVLLGRKLTDQPTIVSLDATPKQYDSLGEHYAHDVGSERVERVKTWLNRRCFERAAHLVTWTQWTKQSLVDDYGIAPDRITVIPPGVDVARWSEAANPDRAGHIPESGNPLRVLFVGGDLRRKGGHHLIDAFTALRSQWGDSIELHLVTTSEVDDIDGVVVHDSMTSNSPELIDLYRRCHIFCLPTLGDCLPMVLAEAGAAGLAVIATDVGAVSDIVRHEQTGLLVPTGDVGALTAALRRFVDDPTFRSAMGSGVHELVATEHDAAANAAALIAVTRRAVAGARRGTGNRLSPRAITRGRRSGRQEPGFGP